MLLFHYFVGFIRIRRPRPLPSKKMSVYKQACSWKWSLLKSFHLMNACRMCGQKLEAGTTNPLSTFYILI